MLRFDRVDITGKAKRTSEGYLRADAVVTRAGVFTYRNADGSVRKEFRSPEEVMRADSLETLKLRPITNGHPPTLLNAATAKKYQVGSTGETVHPAGMLVLASMLVTDGRAVQDAADGKVELSCGYECDVVDSRGTFDGQEYTHEQKNIKYNHVALVEKGRAGSEARLPRFDSMTAEQVADEAEPNAPRIILRKSCMKDLGRGIAVELPSVHMDVWSDEARKAAIEARKGHQKAMFIHGEAMRKAHESGDKVGAEKHFVNTVKAATDFYGHKHSEEDMPAIRQYAENVARGQKRPIYQLHTTAIESIVDSHYSNKTLFTERQKRIKALREKKMDVWSDEARKAAIETRKNGPPQLNDQLIERRAKIHEHIATLQKLAKDYGKDVNMHWGHSGSMGEAINQLEGAIHHLGGKQRG